MKLVLTDRFLGRFRKLSPTLQAQALKQLEFLQANLFHPSLHTKKIKGIRGKIFEARIAKAYRLIFEIQEDRYILLDIGKHEILDKI